MHIPADTTAALKPSCRVRFGSHQTYNPTAVRRGSVRGRSGRNGKRCTHVRPVHAIRSATGTACTPPNGSTENRNRKSARGSGCPGCRLAAPTSARGPRRAADRAVARTDRTTPRGFREYFAVLVSLYLAILLVRAASRPTGTGSGRPGRAGARRKNRSVLGTGASTFFASHDGRYCTRAPPAPTRARAPCARAETPRGI